ncbi:MAG: helix-hairpin-helix domain-containing protein [Chitinophagales bacterium]|nr:helix-hairpin-helix domain-containing protein [Chitinophagales bacterium]
MVKHYFLTFLLIGLSVVLYAQNPDGTDVQEIIENNAIQTESESFDYDANIDELEYYKKHPINLNRTTAEQLNDLGLLTAQQISSLINYIALHGELISVYELQAVPKFDLKTIQLLLPYIEVNNNVNENIVPLKKLLSKGKFTIVSRYKQVVEKSKGYKLTDGNRYLGNPANLFFRFRYQYGTKLSYGFTAEKDAGEEFFKGSNKQGFDYYSGHLFLRDMKVLRALALGDYEVRLGQGLIMWSGFGVRKSPAVMNVKRMGMRLRPYTSLNEFNFMRGAAVTLGKKGFEFTAFGSLKQLDANSVVIGTDTTVSEEEFFTSFNEAGFHRTPNEVADRSRLLTLNTGGNFSYNTKKWHVGANALYTRFFGKYQPTLYPYSQYNLQKNSLLNVSVDYHVLVRNVHLFGEAAMSDNRGFAVLNGAMISVDPKVDLSVVHRYFARNYQSLYANAFGESSRPQNEHGVYAGISIKPIRQIRIDGYFDLYKSNWLKYLTDAPSWGSDNYLQFTVIPNKKMEAYVRYRFEWKKKNQTNNESAFDYLVDDIRQSLRFNVKYKVNESITLSNRVEWSHYRNGSTKPENGFVIYQDVNFKMLGFPLTFNARLAIYKTESYNTRIYAYENDVLYSFSIPAYYYNGMRWYFTARYAITRNIDVWFRVAQNHVFDSKTIGSGLDEINGTQRTELKAQVRFLF